MKKIVSTMLVTATVLTALATPALAAGVTSVAKEPGVTVTQMDGFWYRADNALYQAADYDATLSEMAVRRLQVYGLDSSGAATSGQLAEAMTQLVGTPFKDVSDDLMTAVNWALGMGVTSGTSATTFSPNATVTRGQAVTFLWRAAGSPKVTGANPFRDVKASDYYYDAVLWAVKQGITSGTSATTFSPDATCTRGQIITFLYRAEGSPAAGAAVNLSDVPATAYYATPITWAVTHGIADKASCFNPDAACPRGQIITFIFNAEAGETISSSAAVQAVNRMTGLDLTDAGLTDGTMTSDDMAMLETAVMDAKGIEMQAVKAEIGAPDTINLYADTLADAEAQIEQALRYVPETITVTGAAADALYSKYSNWQSRGEEIPLFISVIDAWASNLLTVTQNGSTVTFRILYNDGWYAYADIQDWLRVYDDQAFSSRLSDFAETYLEPIAERNLSDVETVRAVRDLYIDLCDYDYASIDSMTSGRYTPTSHTLRGLLDDGLMVCDGYAMALNFALSYLDIPSFSVWAKESAYLGHIWNRVQVDGTWYAIDMTLEEEMGHDDYGFFLTSTDSVATKSMTFLRSWYNAIYPCTEFYGYTA